MRMRTLPGTFTYNPASGTGLSTGTTTLSVTFTPTDTTDYSTATTTATIVVLSGSKYDNGTVTLSVNSGSGYTAAAEHQLQFRLDSKQHS